MGALAGALKGSAAKFQQRSEVQDTSAASPAVRGSAAAKPISGMPAPSASQHALSNTAAETLSAARFGKGRSGAESGTSGAAAAEATQPARWKMRRADSWDLDFL